MIRPIRPEEALPRGATIVRDRAVAALGMRAGAGICLVSPGGIGLPDLARDVCAAADLKNSVRVIGNGRMTAVPLGALAPYLGPLAGAAEPNLLTALGGFRGELLRRADTHGIAIVVEQAELLDPASAALLAQVSAEPEISLIILTPDTAWLPRDLRTLLIEGQLVAIENSPLSTSEVAEYATARLGGIVPWIVADTLVRVGGALPQTLDAALQESVRVGALVCLDGVWRFTSEPRLGSTSVWQLRGLIAQFGANESDALVATALAHAIPTPVLVSLFGSGAVATLRGTGLLVPTVRTEPSESGVETLTISSALVAVVLRESASLTVSRALWRRVYPLLPLPDDAGTTLRYAQWALECGGEMDSQGLTVLATLANRADRPALALHAVALDSTRPRPAAIQVQRARAHFYLGEIGSAFQVVEEALEGECSPADLQRFTSLLAHIYSTTGVGRSEVDAAIARWAAAGEDNGYYSVLAARATGLTRPLHAVFGGDYRAAQALSLPLLDLTGQIAAESLLLDLIIGEIVAINGDLAGGIARLEGSLARILRAPDLANYGAFVVTRLVLLQCFAADWDRINSVLEQVTGETNGWMVRQAIVVELMRATQGLQEADLEAAMIHARAGVALARERDPERIRPVVLAYAAYLSVIRGEHDAAEAYLTEFATLDYDGAPIVDGVARSYVAFARCTLAGDGNFEPLWDTARAADRLGHYPARVQALLMLLRVGESAAVPELRELTEGAADPVGRMAHLISVGLTTGRAEDHLVAAELGIELGQHYLAAAALTRSFLELRARPDRVLHRRALGVLALLPPGARLLDPMLDEMRETTVLTERERDIARLVARGMTSREIARHLSLSDRTVDGHVQRVLIKLGLNSRERLQDAIGDIPATAG